MSLPTFLVIGAAKSGTTALYSYLGQHPDVYVPALQEPSWFSFDGQTLEFTAPDGAEPALNRSITERSIYEELFADAAPGQARGDVSPAYLYWPGTAEKARSEVPEARVLAILRNPVDRAYSAFMHARREGREPLADFRSALEAEPERISRNCGFIWRYRDLGRYPIQVRRWLDQFPPDQIMFGTYDEFSADPVGFCRRAQAFIGVDDGFTPRTDVRYNVSGVPRSRTAYRLLGSGSWPSRALRRIAPASARQTLKRIQARTRSRLMQRVPIDPELRAELVAAWRPEVEELSALVDLDLEPWLANPVTAG